jgi:hypothetical protein
MPSTAPHRPVAPSPAPGVTRLGDAEVNFYLLEDPDGLVLVEDPFPGTPADAAALARSAGAR